MCTLFKAMKTSSHGTKLPEAIAIRKGAQKPTEKVKVNTHTVHL